ncbi:MAG: PatB family C-S lyase [Deferrisomatales bacterium]|nr:PatB family C-S lyase [Deferrisomatales bacterium]
MDRRDTASLRWEKYRARDVIPLWVADMDFPAPPAVVDALQRRVAHGVFGYTVPDRPLVDAVLGHLEVQYGWQVEPEWLVWLPGLVCGLNVACRAVAEAGDEVLTTVPIYPPFLSAPLDSGRTVREVPLIQDEGRWRLDRQPFDAALTRRSRLLLLCNPHNPTGRVFSPAELESVGEFCLRNDLVLCSDEIHCDLVLEPGLSHRPAATLSPELAARTITLMAPSKTYNLPGLGCSFAVVSDRRLRAGVRRAMAGIVPHVNLLGLVATAAAYRHGEPWRKALVEYLRANRDLVLQLLNAVPGLHVGPVEATYLAWIDARELPVADPVGFFEAAGVGLSDGREFGAPGFVRLNFGCPRSLLEQALDRMTRAVGKLTGEAAR